MGAGGVQVSQNFTHTPTVLTVHTEGVRLAGMVVSAPRKGATLIEGAGGGATTVDVAPISMHLHIAEGTYQRSPQFEAAAQPAQGWGKPDPPPAFPLVPMEIQVQELVVDPVCLEGSCTWAAWLAPALGLDGRSPAMRLNSRQLAFARQTWPTEVAFVADVIRREWETIRRALWSIRLVQLVVYGSLLGICVFFVWLCC